MIGTNETALPRGRCSAGKRPWPVALLLLGLMMVISFLPASVQAAEEPEENMRLSAEEVAYIKSMASRFDDRARDAVIAVIIASATAQPDLSQRIVAEGVYLAPQFRDGIVAVAQDALPTRAMELAQITPETAKPPPPSPWSGSIDFGGAQSTGNSQTEQVNLLGALQYTTDTWEHHLRTRFDFLRDSGEVSTRRFVASYQPRYNITDRLYGFGIFRYLDDNPAGWRFQVNQNAGLGYRIFPDPPFQWTFESGPGSSQSEDTDNEDLKVQFTWYASNTLSWEIYDGVTISDEATALAGTYNSELSNTIALTVALVKGLGTRIAYDVRYNTNPPRNRKSTDTVARASVVYSF